MPLSAGRESRSIFHPAEYREVSVPFLDTRHTTSPILEWALVLLAAPVLAFPATYPQLTVGVLALVGATIAFVSLFQRQAVELWKLVFPYRLPLAVLIAGLGVGAFVSPSFELTLPKLSGVVLGILVLRAVLLTGTTYSRIRLLAGAYLLIGSLAVVAGVFVSPAWMHKFEMLFLLSSRIPRFVQGLPGAEQGVNPNALGGATLLFLPLAVVLAVQSRGRAAKIYGIAAAALFLVLALSQSRAAWVSAAIVGSVLMVARYRVRLIWVALPAAILTGWMWSRAETLPTILGSHRATIWSLAVESIQTHPLGGVGLGAFRLVVIEAMRQVPIGERFGAPHAHNVFLQVALDAGVIGLVAYVALLVVATRMTYRMLHRDGPAFERALCLGLWSSLFAVHVFGIVDAIVLGAKIGVFFWWNLGLIAALHEGARRRSGWLETRPAAASSHGAWWAKGTQL